MISESPRSSNPAGHVGLLGNLLALINALAAFFESRFALVAEESKSAAVQLLILAGCLIFALLLCALGYVFLITGAVVGIAHLAGISWPWIVLAAAAVGAMIALAPMRRKKIYVDAKSSRKTQKKLVETGFALAALKVVAGLARPVIVEFVKNRLTGFPGKSRRKT